MKKNILTKVAMMTLAIGLAIPTVIISNEPELTISEVETQLSVEDLDNPIVGSAGVSEVIVDEPEIIYLYSTDIIKVHTEPITDESSVVGLIPANAEMLWIEDVDSEWCKVEINEKEYFVSKNYISVTSPAAEDIVTILNIEPTHEGVYFVNNSGEEVSNPNYVSLGTFRLTAYCACEKCCGQWASSHEKDENGNYIIRGAIGERLYEGLSIAVDPTVIPYRSEVFIEGHRYVAHDCGGAIKGNRIDIYFEDHSAAWNFGVQYKEVFIWKY